MIALKIRDQYCVSQVQRDRYIHQKKNTNIYHYSLVEDAFIEVSVTPQLSLNHLVNNLAGLQVDIFGS